MSRRASHDRQTAHEHFDAIVIGSGFGGSVMAYRLAAAGKSVCLLERGKRYPPGSFPRTAREIRNNFWDPKADRQGLFDVWSFDGAEAVVAAGLGGGSLIYANVLIRKDENWFVKRGGRNDCYEDWPLERKDLEPHYRAVESILKPEVYPEDYQRDSKAEAMRAAAVARGIAVTTWDNVDPTIPQWYLPQLAVTFRTKDGPRIGNVFDDGSGNLHNKPRETCRLCGECNIGCNFGSKNTLDFNYLTLAERHGAMIRTRCEAKAIFPPRGSSSTYTVSYIEHTDHPHGGTDPVSISISAGRVIVACGTLGTALLLMRNRANLPKLSSMLGKRFSGNGDYLGFAVRAMKALGKKKTTRRLNASRAPVITSTFRFPDARDGGSNRGRGSYLQDGGYALVGDYLWELVHPFADVARITRFVAKWITGSWTGQRNSQMGSELARLLGSGELSSASMPLLGIGRDLPNGTMRLNRKKRLEILWRDQPSTQYYRRIDREARATAEAFGARYQKNPLTRIFNQLITVHPLGGASMGRSPKTGVVDSFGEVFGYPRLYVADGSVMPGPVGPNPSLTIAALSDRFATRMLAMWGQL